MLVEIFMKLIDDKQDIDIKLELEGIPASNMLQLSHCCHLGATFFSDAPVEEYSEMQFLITVQPSEEDNATIRCKGVVVASDFEDEQKMYKISLLYTDIDVDSQKQLKFFAEGNNLTCPHCQSF